MIQKELFELDANAEGKIHLQIQVNVLFEAKGHINQIN